MIEPIDNNYLIDLLGNNIIPGVIMIAMGITGQNNWRPYINNSK